MGRAKVRSSFELSPFWYYIQLTVLLLVPNLSIHHTRIVDRGVWNAWGLAGIIALN